MSWIKAITWLFDFFSWGGTIYHNVKAWAAEQTTRKTAKAEANIPVTDQEWEEGGREGRL